MHGASGIWGPHASHDTLRKLPFHGSAASFSLGQVRQRNNATVHPFFHFLHSAPSLHMQRPSQSDSIYEYSHTFDPAPTTLTHDIMQKGIQLSSGPQVRIPNANFASRASKTGNAPKCTAQWNLAASTFPPRLATATIQTCPNSSNYSVAHFAVSLSRRQLFGVQTPLAQLYLPKQNGWVTCFFSLVYVCMCIYI